GTSPSSAKTTDTASNKTSPGTGTDSASPNALPANPQDAPKANDQPAKADGGPGQRLPQDVVNRVRKSTVYIETLTASGSGFFGAEPGIILTNAHVLGMLRRGSSEPLSLKVVLNSGEEDEWAQLGEILGVDPSSDLAVLKIRGPREKMPPHLTV